jgi:hypothetical protein
MYQTTGARVSYHAVTAILERRVAGGWGGRLHYTWSRRDDDQFGDGNWYSFGAVNLPQNSYDLVAEYSRKIQDVPHRVILAPILVLRLPVEHKAQTRVVSPYPGFLRLVNGPRRRDLTPRLVRTLQRAHSNGAAISLWSGGYRIIPNFRPLAPVRATASSGTDRSRTFRPDHCSRDTPSPSRTPFSISRSPQDRGASLECASSTLTPDETADMAIKFRVHSVLRPSFGSDYTARY